MKLLFTDFTLPQLLKDSQSPAGGWAVQLSYLLAALSKTQHRAGVLTWKGANAFVGPQSICDLLETYDCARGGRGLRFFYLRAPAMFAAARRYRPDVIIQSTSGLETGLMSLIASALRVPFVHRIACDTDSDGRENLYLGRIGQMGFRLGIGRAAAIICQNEYQRSRITERFRHKTVCTLHNAIALPARLARPLARNQRDYVAWVANFRRQKNLPLLAKIARRCPEMEFRVAGARQEPLDPETQAALAELGRLPNVRLVGYLTRAEVFDFVADAVALLCTSDYEGFSNTFLEAFAAGTPVVTRAMIDPDGIIARNGLGAVAGNGDDLAAATRAICALESDRYDRLAANCRRYVETHHAPEAAAAKLISILEPSVLNARRSRYSEASRGCGQQT